MVNHSTKHADTGRRDDTSPVAPPPLAHNRVVALAVVAWAWILFVAYHVNNNDYYQTKISVFGAYFLRLIR